MFNYRFVFVFAFLLMFIYGNLFCQCQSNGNIWLSNQEKMEDFAFIYGNAGCDTVKGNLIIGDYASVSDIVSLASLSFLKAIKGDLYIEKTLLNDLNGIGNINTIDGGITIRSNALLENLSGFPNVSNIYESVIIEYNDTLSNLSGLEDIESIAGSLNIKWNKSLKNLDGLQSLNFCKALFIEDNLSLENLSGLNNLNEIQSGAYVRKNEQLKNLKGLGNLEKISIFEISTNNNITSLEGVHDIVNIENKLYVYGNGSLSGCNEPWVCNHLELDGEAAINGNSDGCKTIEQVKSGCTTNTNAVSAISNTFFIYPNPTDDHFEIKTKDQNSVESVTILNVLGEIVDIYEKTGYLYDISAYPKGYYFVQIKSKLPLVVKRLVKH